MVSIRIVEGVLWTIEGYFNRVLIGVKELLK